MVSWSAKLDQTRVLCPNQVGKSCDLRQA